MDMALWDAADFHLDGFNIICFDSDARKTPESIGGGLCVTANNKWATNFMGRECCKHYELMTVSFRLHYLPWEFSQITVILVYLPGPDLTPAAEHTADIYNRAVNRTGKQPGFLQMQHHQAFAQSGTICNNSHQKAENTGLVL